MGEQTLLSVTRFIITRFLCPGGREGGGLNGAMLGRRSMDRVAGFEPGMGLVIDIFF